MKQGGEVAGKNGVDEEQGGDRLDPFDGCETHELLLVRTRARGDKLGHLRALHLCVVVEKPGGSCSEVVRGVLKTEAMGEEKTAEAEVGFK